MAILLTGSTGYIGAHIAAKLLERGHDVNLLVRAASAPEAHQRLWRALQLHMAFPRFEAHLRAHIQPYCGDITETRFGLPESAYNRLLETTDSVIHCAASLNRKSEKSCLNVNLRGTLELIQFTRRAHAQFGVRRFSHVSTVAVAGQRQSETVHEDAAIDWSRSDYDPYARTKKFCELMVQELLPEGVSHLVFRPSIVLGDSRYGETTQFEMVRAFVFLARLPVLPFEPSDRVDIVPVEFVADSIVALHLKAQPEHNTYHLSSGKQSQTFRELTDAISSAGARRRPLYVPALRRPFTAAVESLSRRRSPLGSGASLLKVFLPYLYWNTVFDNTRVVSELGVSPKLFSEYCFPLYKFSTENRFVYRYKEWSATAAEPEPPSTGGNVLPRNATAAAQAPSVAGKKPLPRTAGGAL